MMKKKRKEELFGAVYHIYRDGAGDYLIPFFQVLSFSDTTYSK
jgi:hypothetical protein